MTQMNLSMKQKQTQREKRLVVTKGEGWIGSLGLADSNYILYTEWVNNKVLLYSTGNYIPYPVINQNRKNMKNNVYICITESLCCTAEINTTL